MKLYEIDEQIRQCIDYETGEIIDPDYLNHLEIIRERKIEGVALYCKELTGFADQIDAEIKSLQKRKKSAETAVKSMKNWLTYACNGQKFETVRAKITFRESEETVIDNEDLLLKKYFTKKIVYTPSKTAIKDALMAGKKVKGAHIEKHLNATIK